MRTVYNKELFFDPIDDEQLLELLEAKERAHADALADALKFFPTIPTLGESGSWYTHPEKIPGVSPDGQIRYFFHRAPFKAYTTRTREKRKVHTDEDGSETRWHRTGKSKPIYVDGVVKGFKKILVLFKNYGRQRKPEKTNWVMHQYHLGSNEEEKNGQLMLSKVFYETQHKQSDTAMKDSFKKRLNHGGDDFPIPTKVAGLIEHYNGVLENFS